MVPTFLLLCCSASCTATSTKGLEALPAEQPPLQMVQTHPLDSCSVCSEPKEAGWNGEVWVTESYAPLTLSVTIVCGKAVTQHDTFHVACGDCSVAHSCSCYSSSTNNADTQYGVNSCASKAIVMFVFQGLGFIVNSNEWHVGSSDPMP